jgi:hypothetical protein
MRTSHIPQVAISTVIATSLAYLINQLPPIPEVPNKTVYIYGGLILFVFLTIVVAIWQTQKEARKSLRAEQSNPSYSTNNSQFAGISTQKQLGLNLSQASHAQYLAIPWNSLLTLGLLHFFPALVFGTTSSPLGVWAVAGLLTGTVAVAWAWTWIWTWAVAWGGGRVAVLILLLAGKGAWAWFLFLFFVSVIAWFLNGAWAGIVSVFESKSRSGGWSWTWALGLAWVGALLFAQAWAWIGAVTVAIALGDAVAESAEKLERSFSPPQICLILGLNTIVSMAMGGLIGWVIRVANQY